MNNTVLRTITGFFIIAITISCIWFSFVTFIILFSFILIFGLWEFYTLVSHQVASPFKFTGIIIGELFFLSFCHFAYYGNAKMLLLPIPFLFLVFLLELFRKKEHPFTNIAFTFLGLIYIVVPLSLWPLALISTTFIPESNIGQIHYVSTLLIGYFILIWTCDTFAYITGKAFGRNKLYESVSPKKTWEGVIGGGIAGLIGSYILASFGESELLLAHWLIIAVIITVTGTMGDLIESKFKRSINIKDSGGIIPGHGGILDRFDAVFISTPFVCVYLLLIR